MSCANTTGVIAVTMTAGKGKGTIRPYTPTAPTAGGAIGTQWRCVGSGSAAKYYPAECR
jgi:type IV pilus assembly protein PilA